MAEHAWCRSPARDEAVRASEDGRPGPLPTLEEAIAVVTDRRPVQPGGGGNVTGLRTERVTLEVTYRWMTPPSAWNWNHVITSPLVTLKPGESVRVVEETHFDDLAQVSMECDAAIRERDAAKSDAEKSAVRIKSQAENVAYFRRDRDETVSERAAAIRERDEHKARADYLERDRKYWCVTSGFHERQANALRVRVAEMESAAKLAPAANADAVSNPRPISGDGKSAGEETQAASGAAGTEPLCWTVRPNDIDHDKFHFSSMGGVYGDPEDAKYDPIIDDEGGTVVPLYAAPQPAPGWLTAEEREVISYFREVCQGQHERAIGNDSPRWGEISGRRAAILQRLLARSSPPEVVLPESWREAGGEVMSADEVRAALAAAGVTVKEVGSE